eukprot:371638-Rhodomonas_salina.1
MMETRRRASRGLGPSPSATATGYRCLPAQVHHDLKHLSSCRECGPAGEFKFKFSSSGSGLQSEFSR